MKRTVFAFLLLFTVLFAKAQESETAYNFLRLPVSGHAAALGGENVTLTDDDVSLVFHNPALINNVSDKTVGLNFMTYMEGAKAASAAFVRGAGDRASWGVAAQYMDYGSMKETTYDNQELGTFSARDIALAGSFAYALTEKLSGGITARFISSHIASYNSLGVGVDLGLNYYHDESELSVSLVAKNLGGQIKAYDDDFEKMPFDLQLGITKRLSHSPFRFSVTLSRLTDWSQGFGRHLTIGADILLSEEFYLAAGYNFRKAHEMKISDGDGSSNHGAGLSLGGGLQLQRLKINVAYAKYHVSSNSLVFNLAYTL
ncbi:MAG: type IX secretion system protein PorQ [Prevotella sp.]|nr:type IX secretion system protein PorQ [Prevotella sp.]